MDVGSVQVRIGALFDRRGFDQFEKEHVKAQRAKDIEARLGGDFDPRSFREYDRALDQVQQRVKRREAFKATLGGDFDSRAFNQYERAMTKAQRDNNDVVKSTGRVKTAFGSVWGGGGAAFAALGGVYALGNAVRFMLGEQQEAVRVNAQTAQVLKTTGGAAGLTAKEIGRLSERLSQLAGVDDEVIQQGANVMLTFVRVRDEMGRGNNVFSQGVALALDMSKALGKDLQGSVIQVGKALNDPIKGVTALGRAGVQFTKEQKEQIKTLVESGDQLGAQRIILSELRKEFGGTAAATATSTDKLNVSLGNVAEKLGAKLNPHLQKAADWLIKFIDQMETGKGAGGDFADVMRLTGRAISEFAGWVKESVRTVKQWGDSILGVVSTVLGGFSDLATVGSKIPGIGGKFKGLADDINKARRGIDGFRESLRGGPRDSDRLAKSLEHQQGVVNALRGRLSSLDRGTKAYKDTARALRQEEGRLNSELGRTDAAGRKAARGFQAASGGADSAAATADEAGRIIASSFNSLASQFGTKGVTYKATVRKIQQGAKSSPGRGFGPSPGDPGTFAGGGIPNPGSGAGDDHILFDPMGRPVAALSGTEGILNRPQMGIVDWALRATAALGLNPYGGLDELWGSGMRHFATGGSIVPVPGFPGERANAAILDEIRAVVSRWPRLRLTDAFGPGHSSPGHTVTGTAADFSGPDRDMDAAVRWLTSQGYRVGYDGRFGSQNWPGHGPSTRTPNFHFHVEFGGAGGAGLSAAMPNLPGVNIDGPGPMGAMLRRFGSRLTAAGQRRLERSAAMPVPGGGGGMYSKRALMSLWSRVNPGLGNPNLMAAIALAESGGDPSIVNSIGAGGLWQIHPPEPNYLNPTTNARIAGRKLRTQGLKAWEAYTRGMHRAYLAGGGLLQRFAGGGKLKPAPVGSVRHARELVRDVRPLQTDRIEEYEWLRGRIGQLNTRYGILDRTYSLDVEELIDEKTGLVNEAAVKERAAELAELARVRHQIVNRYEKALAVARRVIQTYTNLLGRLRRSRAAAPSKSRPGITGLIQTYTARRREWRGSASEIHTDLLPNARLDWRELVRERAEVLGTKAEPRDPEPAVEADVLPADTSATADTEPTQAAPTAEQIAAGVLAAFETFQKARADLFANYGANFALGMPVGAGPQAAGARNWGAFGGTDAGGQAAPTTNIEIHNTYGGPPPDPHTWSQQQRFEVEGAMG